MGLTRCYKTKVFLHLLQLKTVVNNLGIHLDSQLTMADHTAVVTRSGFLQL